MDFFDIIYYFGLALTVLFAKFVFANILPKQAPTYKHAGKKKVCVLGAGVSGLVSAKALLEDDHDVTVFEKANVIGGVWKFPEERKTEVSGFGRDREGGAAGQVWHDLITTSSASISSFSDIYPAKEYVDGEDARPNPFHMSCGQYYNYLKRYLKTNNLEKHIQLGWVCNKMKQLDNGKWELSLSQGTGWNYEIEGFEKVTDTKKEVFDFVVLATGQHQHQKLPSFPGLDKYKGDVVHSNNYINAKPYQDKSVLVIGGGDSAADIVKQIGDVSKPGQTYASLRHGAHVAPRYFHKDTFPFDYAMFRWSFYLPHFVRVHLRDTAYRKHLDRCVDETSDPKTKAIIEMLDLNGLSEEQYFTTKSAQFCQAISEKKAILKPEVKTFTADGAIFKNITKGGADPSPVKVDSVVICTGFKTVFPMLPDKFREHTHRERYKLVFHPEVSNVAFVGFVRPSGLGSIPPLAEMQSRWMSAVVSGKVRLPSKEAMIEDAAKAKARFKKQRKFNNEMLVTYAYYLSDIAKQVNCRPEMFKLLLTDPTLWWNCLMKPFTSHQYRLNGVHPKYKVARDIIINRVSMPKPNSPDDHTPIIRPNPFVLGAMTVIFGMIAEIPILGRKFRKCI